MPTSSQINHPACLHVPPLAEGGAATIAWAQVDEAEKYELDCSFDECFSDADTGKTWGNIHDQGKPCSEIGKALSWRDLESLPAQGSAWYGLESKNLSWADSANKGLSWGEFHKQAPRYTVYMGPGTAFEISDISGIWGNLNARSLEWGEVHKALPSWQDLPQDAFDEADHLSHTMQLPLSKKAASYRARALANNGDASGYITSAKISITPLFARESNLRMNVVQGNEYTLLLHTRDIDRLSDVALTLDYSPFFLQLSKSAPHIAYGIQLGNIQPIPPQRLFARDGRVQFRWPRDKDGDTKSSRPVILFQVKALQTGSTQVKIY